MQFAPRFIIFRFGKMKNNYLMRKTVKIFLPSLVAILLHLVVYFYLRKVGLPEENYLFAAISQNQFQTDEVVRTIYSLLRPPLIIISDDVFLNYKLYFSLLILSISLCGFSIYYFFQSLLKSKLYAVTFSLLGNPFFYIFLSKHGILSSGVAKDFYISSGRIIGAMDPTYSGRPISYAVFALCLSFVLKRKFHYVNILIFIGFLVHPNNSISMSAIFLTYYISLYVRKSLNYKYFIGLIVSVLGGVLSVIPKLYSLSGISSGKMSSFNWYLQMTANEGDDFSGIHHLYNVPDNLLRSFLMYIFPILIFLIIRYGRFRGKKIPYSNEISECGWLSIIPVIIFIGSVALEVFINFIPSVSFIYGPFVSGQLALKVAKFTYLPCLVVVLTSILYFIRLKFEKALKLILFLLVLIICIKSANKVGQNFKFHLTFKDVIAENPIKNLNLFPLVNNFYKEPEVALAPLAKINTVFDVERINRSSQKKYLLEKQNFRTRYREEYNPKDIVRAVIKHIPKGEGIIVPPYMVNWRGALPYWPIFYQEKQDGNIAIGNKKAAEILKDRFQALFDKYYLEFYGENSGFLFYQMRMEFLKISSNRMLKLARDYSRYNYLITEKEHRLDFKEVYIDDYFVIYKID